MPGVALGAIADELNVIQQLHAGRILLREQFGLRGKRIRNSGGRGARPAEAGEKLGAPRPRRLFEILIATCPRDHPRRPEFLQPRIEAFPRPTRIEIAAIAKATDGSFQTVESRRRWN